MGGLCNHVVSLKPGWEYCRRPLAVHVQGVLLRSVAAEAVGKGGEEEEHFVTGG